MTANVSCVFQLKIKQEKEHEMMQKERNKAQLEAAKQASVERLVDELNDKETRLRYMVCHFVCRAFDFGFNSLRFDSLHQDNMFCLFETLL